MNHPLNKYVIRLLSRRDYSEAELRQKLSLKNIAADEVERVIAYCDAHGWINDQRFAESLLRGGAAKGYGWKRICFDAQKKGIDENLLQQAQKIQQHNWYALAEKLAIKRFGDKNGEIPDVDLKTKNKWMRFLVGRGFSYEIVAQVLNSTVFD